MSKIIPFKAVRPTPDKVGLVTCRNYDEYEATELAAWLTINPYSFLHVVHPIYANNQKKNDIRYKSVGTKYEEFKVEDVFLKEDKPCFYVYEIQSKSSSFTGIIAGASVEDYQNNVIKKHEDTLQYRVELFKNYLHQTQFNTEPVLMTYPDSIPLNTWILLKKQSEPLYQFSTTSKEKHTLWRIDTQSDIDWLQDNFKEIPNLYIADGHHRSASAALLFEEDKHLGNENLHYFMSFLIPESKVKIYEFNRIIKDLNGHSKEQFLKLLSSHFIVKAKGQELWKPQQKSEFGMYLDNNFYALEYKNKEANKSVLQSLDAQILYETILNPILGIEDLRNDDRIDYVSGKQSITAIKEAIDNEEYTVGFMLFPSNIDEIKAFADNNLIMPPKSTFIEPKFRSGLIVYEL